MNKAHQHVISIRMIKISEDSLVRPLSLLFKKSFENSYFSNLWKKKYTSYYTSPQKNEKQNFQSYHPISLLPIFSTVFEKLIFN